MSRSHGSESLLMTSKQCRITGAKAKEIFNSVTEGDLRATKRDSVIRILKNALAYICTAH